MHCIYKRICFVSGPQFILHDKRYFLQKYDWNMSAHVLTKHEKTFQIAINFAAPVTDIIQRGMRSGSNHEWWIISKWKETGIADFTEPSVFRL
jgi:hypothetical protein